MKINDSGHTFCRLTQGGGLGCHVWRSFRLVSSGAACVVEDVASVRRTFSLTYVLTYGKTYGGTYVLAYALTGGAYIYLVTPSIVRPLLPHWCVCLVSLLYKKPQPQGGWGLACEGLDVVALVPVFSIGVLVVVRLGAVFGFGKGLDG